MKYQFEQKVNLLFGAKCPSCGQKIVDSCNFCDSQNIRETKVLSFSLAQGESPTTETIEVIVAFRYLGIVRQMILRFKYRNQRASLHFLGNALVGRIRDEIAMSLNQPEIITWAPTSNRHKVARGRDHAEIIANYVARELRVPCKSLLRKLSNESQTGQSRLARLSGPKFLSRKLVGQHVIVVDDIVTTGATLLSAKRALKLAGAGRVTCVAVASTVLWRSSTESCVPVKARK